ncbi:hypothetical protein [Sphingobium sp.]|jgi:hypothetical protein|uniref:hypothetical protein n=1 Tax=Sphingobium sp. TaxID=1912891 RepID=UPI002580C7A9|nr:hypothetical protein [Sphingobium sp.]MBR2269732.1 hypothetical protein [Sphingobium sp.]
MQTALIIGLAITLGIWVVGLGRLWRLQSASQASLKVEPIDRLFAIFWLPIAILALVAALPLMARQWLVRRQRR